MLAGVALMVTGTALLMPRGAADFGSTGAAASASGTVLLPAAESSTSAGRTAPASGPSSPSTQSPQLTQSSPPTLSTPTAQSSPLTPAAPTTPAASTAPGTTTQSSPSAEEFPTPRAVDVPVGLRLPSVDVTADVVPVGVENGVLGVPEDPLDVGWWTGSAESGAPVGTTVLDGHVDSAQLGLGAFYRLRDLVAGDAVQVTLQSGATLEYRVDARATYPKSDGLPAELFDLTGSPRLVLITCGGDFERSKRSYEANVVVFASPT